MCDKNTWKAIRRCRVSSGGWPELTSRKICAFSCCVANAWWMVKSRKNMTKLKVAEIVAATIASTESKPKTLADKSTASASSRDENRRMHVIAKKATTKNT
eukprot:66948-Prymnesium_polylepis.2